MGAKHRVALGILSTLKLIEATLAKELIAVSTFNWSVNCT
jgi:hypothetical protein